MWPFQTKISMTEVKVLVLTPRDRVVLETNQKITADQADYLRRDLAKALGIDTSAVLVVYNASLKILREGEPPPPKVILSPGHP